MRRTLRLFLAIASVVLTLVAAVCALVALDIWQAKPMGLHLRRSGMVVYHDAEPNSFFFMSAGAIFGAALCWTIQQRLKGRRT